MSDNLTWENPENEEVLKTLARAIALSQGDFSLCLVRCNYLHQRDKMVARLQELSPLPLRQLVLNKSIKTLFSTIQQKLGEEQPNALIVLGLEAVDDLDGVLNSANQVREEFSKSFAFPLLLWITDEVQRKFIRIVPDIESWATTHRLGFSPEEVIQLIAENVQRVVERLVEVGAGIFVENAALDLAAGSPRRLELTAARQEVQTAGIELAPELQVGLEFILTRDIDYYGEKSRQCYERGLELLQKTGNSQRSESVNAQLLAGCLLYHLGLWWRRYGVEHRAEYDEACDRAQSYFQQCVDLFVNAQQPDLAARFINALGDVLQRRQKWIELAKVAETALTWHQTYPHPFRLARAYGFLAEVAISESDWDRGWELATTAGELLESAAKQVTPEDKPTVDWERSTHGSWYLLSQARSLAGKGEYQSAIAKLETAIQQSKPQYDPMLYILILEEMRSLYFQSKEFLAAFQTKQLQRSIEQQFGFRAFIGAGRVQAKQYVSNLALTPGSMASEIAASGREQDVKRLIARIERADHRLTIIHGQSGVGKSSILQAGLIPALRQITLDARQLVPVLQQVYPDWVQELGKSLMAMVEEVKPGAWLGNEGKAIAPILEQLRKNNPAYLLTVLIFDQFEEFFFIYKEPQQRRHFYEFLKQCMDIPHVKVILSLREDYLHYLLECNNRLINLGVINNNILDKGILYYLGNFSPEDAKQVIQNLTRQSQFNLEPSLLDELVRDLAGELGEVRPIELQVVGAQLQTEKIVTLKQYQEHGPKNAIVGRFLDEVVQDCGTDNEQIAKLILYLLTDENNTRPLKTRADLEMELEVSSERLDLVLEILVTSRLVFRIPAFPEDRYQLVHDYLVSFVRQQQSSQLIAELEKEREQRKLTEARLNQVLKRQLQTARKATLTLAGFLVAIGGFAILSTVVGINMYLTNLSLSSVEKKELERLVLAIKAGKEFKRLSIGVMPETTLRIASELNRSVYGIAEIARLEGHTNSVNSISFSPDSKLLASVSEDKTVKIWHINGTLFKNLEGHTGNITSVTFSADGKMLATASEDKTIKIWSLDGGKTITLNNDKYGINSVTSLGFSPDGQSLAIGTENQGIKILNIQGSIIKDLKGHKNSLTSVNFSPDGKLLVSTDKYNIKLWNSDGQDIKTIENYGAVETRFSEDGKNIVITNINRTVKFYNLEGVLLKNINNNRSDMMLTNLSPDGKIFASVHRWGNRYITIEKTNSEYVGIGFAGHNDKITHLQFSPDGKILASASKDKEVKLWRIDKDTLAKEHKHPDNKIFFISKKQTIISGDTNKKVRIWRNNGSLIKTIQADDSVFKPSQDGKIFVTGSAEEFIKTWNINGKEIDFKEHTDGINNIVFSHDGQIIASTTRNNTVKLWKRDGTLIKVLKGHKDTVAGIIFSFDNKIIATFGEDNVVKLWDRKGNLINTLFGHTQKVTSVVFSPDSKILASIGDDNIVKLWNNDGKLINKLVGHEYQVSSISFSQDSQILASVSLGNGGERSEIKLWRRNGTLINSIDDYGIENIHFSPDSKILASLHNDKNVKLWNNKGQFILTFKKHNDEINDINFSPDSKMIASASSDSTIKLWDRNGTVIQTLTGHNRKINHIIFSPNGKMIVSASDDNMIKLWNSQGKEIKTLQEANKDLDNKFIYSKIFFSFDSKIISFASIIYDFQGNQEYIIKLWDDHGSILKSIDGNNIANLNQISFSNDGQSIGIVSNIDNLNIWNIDGKLLSKLKGHGSKINSVDCSPDGQLIVSASDDKTVRIWNKDGHLLHTLKHDDKVNSVSFSSDGQSIVSASDDKTVRIWNKYGVQLKIIKHQNEVKNAIFSPDNQTIASIGNSNDIQLWWSSSGTERQTITKNSSYTTKFSFSPDSKIIAFTETKISPASVKLYMLDSFSFKDTFLSKSRSFLEDISFSPDGSKIALAGVDGISLLSLDIDELLVRGCNWARDYLKNNPNVKESDRHLCDDVPKELPPAKEK